MRKRAVPGGLPGFLLASCLWSAAAGAAFAAWQVETVDAPVGMFFDVHSGVPTHVFSLAALPSGGLGLAYGGDHLYYAVFDGAVWRTEVADPTDGVGAFPSLAFDPSGFPAISYYDRIDGDLRFARWDGVAWRIEIVDSDGDVGAFSSIALDGSGRPVIAYLDWSWSSRAVKFARWNGTEWEISTVDAAAEAYTGRMISLALDSRTGYPAFCYLGQSGDDLKLARWDGTSWGVEVVDTSVDGQGFSPSLALDTTTGYPTVAYWWMGYPGAVRVARWDGSSWGIENVDESVRADGSVSLALDESSGYPRVSYTHGQKAVKLARFDGATWQIEDVAPLSSTVIGRFPYTSLALDTTGRPAIVYTDYVNNDLKCARWTGSSWDVEVAGRNEGTGGQQCSLAVGSDGRPAIAHGCRPYIDLSPSLALAFSRYDGASWKTETVDGSFEAGYGPSLKIGPLDGYPLISYGDYANEMIKLASWDGTLWNIQVVDTYNEQVLYTSLAIDSITGCPSVAYTHGGLVDGVPRVARWEGSSWSVTTVGPDPYVISGDQFSLALDPVTEYPSVSSADLLRSWDGLSWQEPKHGGKNAGQFGSLALDNRGVALMAFRDDVAGAPMLARWDGASWTVETIDPDARIAARLDASWGNGPPISLALNEAGLPAVAYGDMASDSIRLASWNGAQWRVEAVAGLRRVGSDCAVSLAIAPDGTYYVSFYNEAAGDLMLATNAGNATLYRATVGALGTGWKTTVLPLDYSNDDETLPFPMFVSVPGSAEDALPTAAPLTLYRVLYADGTPAADTLRAVKKPGGVRLVF